MSAPTVPDVVTDEAHRLLSALNPVCELSDYRVRFGKIVGEPETCDLPASWILHTTCVCGAGASSLICDPHHDVVIVPRSRLVCAVCRRAGAPKSLSVERI